VHDALGSSRGQLDGWVLGEGLTRLDNRFLDTPRDAEGLERFD
jgi:hypothetical protein